jgi:antirestriction protein ArdC
MQNKGRTRGAGFGASPPDASVQNKSRRFAREFSFFNVAQIEDYDPPAIPALSDNELIPRADAFIAALNTCIVAEGDCAFYRPSTDTMHAPPFARFVDSESAIAVTLHECAHATGAPDWLDRDLSGRFGSHAYAMEEAVAELTASFVLADLSIRHDPRPDHAAYLSSLLAALKDDPSALFTAASKAQAAADWMNSNQLRCGPQPDPCGQVFTLGRYWRLS